jgi:transposase
VDNKLDANSLWAKEVKDRRNFNIDSMAMANKMVRIAYALLSKGESFRTDTASVSMA